MIFEQKYNVEAPVEFGDSSFDYLLSAQAGRPLSANFILVHIPYVTYKKGISI
jgi:hypothetical protein